MQKIALINPDDVLCLALHSYPLLLQALYLGREHGLWTEWHMNGVKRLETSYEEGKIVGTRISWYPNGQKAWQYNDEVSISWDKDGNITEKRIYKDGKLIESSTP